MVNLLSSTSRIEAPFIIAKIAGFTFGGYSRSERLHIDQTNAASAILTQYPNFMESLTINKINGSVNTYSLVLKYAIRAGEDPNLLERIFSKAKQDRRIILSYGDASVPSFIYKEEEAIISDIKSSFNVQTATITYTLTCVSQALNMTAGSFSFGARQAKPSDVIKELLTSKEYGLADIFPGMLDMDRVNQLGLIQSDDIVVRIEAKSLINILDYLNYLVTCMTSSSDSAQSIVKTTRYALAIYDDIYDSNHTGITGTYFRVTKITADSTMINSLDTYEINVGFPGADAVMSFNIDDNQTYSILYDYSEKMDQSNYIYRINNSGELENIYSPALSKSKDLMKTTESDRTWWTQVTQYPINATLVIKGLLKPSILMTYVKLNVMFYGRKHLSSGYYVITRQTDVIDANGYKTTLKLLRVKGDE